MGAGQIENRKMVIMCGCRGSSCSLNNNSPSSVSFISSPSLSSSMPLTVCEVDSIESWLHSISNAFVFPHRATIEEVEGDVCELESKLDKVSTTHEKQCLIVHLFYCVNWQLQRPSCKWKVAGFSLASSPVYPLADCLGVRV